MQKWEYLTVTPEPYSNILPVRYINGKEQPNWNTMPDIYEYMNVLGEQGWELVAAPYTETYVPYYSGGIKELTRRFIFKRPKL